MFYLRTESDPLITIGPHSIVDTARNSPNLDVRNSREGPRTAPIFHQLIVGPLGPKIFEIFDVNGHSGSSQVQHWSWLE